MEGAARLDEHVAMPRGHAHATVVRLGELGQRREVEEAVRLERDEDREGDLEARHLRREFGPGEHRHLRLDAAAIADHLRERVAAEAVHDPGDHDHRGSPARATEDRPSTARAPLAG